ncbi:hypothetical protein MAR_030765 [Mya arenaria]|uniref:Uncharacterized protein n=1 Tax=Mya arenaria TaxID=6604 RepID=A0ABY7F553_MYAAR|nr:hypothetical protein MAR_030765 [Mya arenaria]
MLFAKLIAIKTALQINDKTIIDRLSAVANGDLVAVEARYHRRKGCLATYYSYARTCGRTQPKTKLLGAIWPEIAFVHQHGKSDLVCSSNKTIGEAIREAKQIEQIIQHDNECSYENTTESEPETDETIVHKAIGILRRRVMDYNSTVDMYYHSEYYSPNEMNMSAHAEFCEPLLYKGVCWLSDRKCFNAASETTNRKCITLARDTTTLVTSTPSPKHLGLVTPSGGIVPDNIASKQRGGKLVVAVADNWDHNERTVDGKRTTHAMTSILVSSTSVENRISQR